MTMPCEKRLERAREIAGLVTEIDMLWLRDNAFGRCAELGSLRGKSSCAIASSPRVTSLVCIDVWSDLPSWRQFATNTADMPVIGIRGESALAALMFPDGYFHFVFIDTSHTEEQTRKEITAWRPKVAAGGTLCGHDYGWEGLTKVVDEMLSMRKVEGGMWVVRGLT